MACTDLTGSVFGLLTVLREAEGSTAKRRRWTCLCECGRESTPRGDALLSGATRSCGKCLRRVRGVEYRGASQHPLFRIWSHMVDRCTNRFAHNYRWYGGAGVTVCSAWLESFTTFAGDVGERPSKKHTLDRFPNKHGNYEPGNVRWATRYQQANNAKSNIMFTIGDDTHTLKQWSRVYGVNYKSLHYHVVRMGRDILDAVERVRITAQKEMANG